MYNFDVVTSKAFFEVIKLYLLSLISFSLGVIIYYEASNKSLKKLFNKSFSEKLFFQISTNKNLINKARNLLVVILLLYFLFMVNQLLLEIFIYQTLVEEELLLLKF